MFVQYGVEYTYRFFYTFLEWKLIRKITLFRKYLLTMNICFYCPHYNAIVYRLQSTI